MLDEPIEDQASVDENVNRVAIQFLDFGLGDEAMDPEFSEVRGCCNIFFRCVSGLFCEGARATRVFLFAAPGWGLRQPRSSKTPRSIKTI